jgi:hypothetical protein
MRLFVRIVVLGCTTAASVTRCATLAIRRCGFTASIGELYCQRGVNFFSPVNGRILPFDFPADRIAELMRRNRDAWTRPLYRCIVASMSRPSKCNRTK